MLDRCFIRLDNKTRNILNVLKAADAEDAISRCGEGIYVIGCEVVLHRFFDFFAPQAILFVSYPYDV
jgi:hypothetical protein